MSFSVWEQRGIPIDGCGAFSSICDRVISSLRRFASCVLILCTSLCVGLSPIFSEKKKIAFGDWSSFTSLDGEPNRRFFSLDGLISSVQVYLNPKAQKNIVFLPDPREAIYLRLAEYFKKKINVYVFPDRNGRKRDIRYLGGIYLNHLKFYQAKMPIHRRRSFKVKSPYIWDFFQVSELLSKNEDFFVFLSSFSLKQLLELNINQKKFKKLIIISPISRFLQEDFSDFLMDAQILWVDSLYQSTVTKQFQEKYGGETLFYPRSGRGATIFFRNSQAISDVTQWILAN